MQRCHRVFPALLAFLSMAVPSICAGGDADPAVGWHCDLYLDGGGYWKKRVAVLVYHTGKHELAGYPLAVPIGRGGNRLPLAGARAETVRVCTAGGLELKFGIWAPNGFPIMRGPVPEGSVLVLPVTVEGGGSGKYYVYWDNPRAIAPPEFLPERPLVMNGDLERGEGETPTGWVHDRSSGPYRVQWVSETARSGSRCLKTTVTSGAEPRWIATRQHGIRIVGGGRYRFEAWVKAKDVNGFAGWYLHIGNAQTPMLAGPILSAGGGTYDWKKVELVFTAPPEADRVSIGTVLRGTGTAWFDDARLEQLDAGPVKFEVGETESLDLREPSDNVPWDVAGPEASRYDFRAVLHVDNWFRDSSGAVAALDATYIRNRLKGKWNLDRCVLISDGKTVPFDVIGDLLIFPVSIPPQTIQRCDLYLSTVSGEHAARSATSVANIMEGIVGKVNLVRNGGFEDVSASEAPWTRTGEDEGVTFSLEEPDRNDLGTRCARLDIPSGLPTKWRGWTQRVPVKPGRVYVVSALVRTRNVTKDLRVHVHLRKADGRLVEPRGIVSIGPPIRGTSDWRQVVGLVRTAVSTAYLDVHLTTNGEGTVWYDNVRVFEAQPARLIRFEGRPLRAHEGLVAWQVPAVIKVFPEDPAPPSVQSVKLSAAKGEREPLQIALRAGKAYREVRIDATAPLGPGGFQLPKPEVCVARTVRVDYPSRYYVSRDPAWVRHVPHGPPGCDGWPGMWPDPLEPANSFRLDANVTRAVWVFFRVPTNAPAGRYDGRLHILGRNGTTEAGEKLVIPYTIRVWDFTLPEERHLAAIYDIRFGPGARLWGMEFGELYRAVVELMAERRLCPDRIWPDPVFRRQGDGVVADFEEYDRAARLYFRTYRFPVSYTPRILYSFGWGHVPRTLFGERPYEGEQVDRTRLRPQYRRLYQDILRQFWEHIKTRGWADQMVLYVSDEPLDRYEHIRQQMRAVCEMIHEVDPAIPIYSSTWHYVPDWDGYLDIWGLGHDGRVPPEQLASIRAKGDRIWFTTDGQMCLDTPYAAVERLLPYYCFKYDVEAYEFWGCTWLTYNPWQYGWHAFIHQSMEPGRSYWIRYPNGDGYLLYPGKPIGREGVLTSIRFEQAAEGVEDYEYLYLLRGLVARARETGRGDLASAGEQVLREAADLVDMPNAGGRYSTKILPDPERLYRVRERLGQTIERLNRELQ